MNEADARRDPAELLEAAEQELQELGQESQRAAWVYATNVSLDAEYLSSVAESRYIDATVRHAKAAASLPSERLTAEQARKVRLLRLSLSLIAPADPRESRELTSLVTAMQGMYARGRHTPLGASQPVDLQGLSKILFESRDPAVLEDAWTGWHRVGRAMRPSFERYVELANRGARELGFSDTGSMWASKYDMEPDEFVREVDRLWSQVRPLYEALHAFVRGRLAARYGAALVPDRGPLPCQLLGDMWAQSWEGIYPLVAPAPEPNDGSEIDLDRVLKERQVAPLEMVRYGERFFDSLGFAKLPATFWERSMFVRPRDREVICHASAWDIDLVDDLRIKMCIEPTAEDFQTIHHELGHNYYQRAYNRQPLLFRDGAHDGFHEAIGDAVGLSVTPAYLAQVGLLAPEVRSGPGFPFLLRRALEKIPFLPFGVVIDKWRWEVFGGTVSPREYNRRWWELRAAYPGVAPPQPRGEEEFDPGAKYHIPANVPYVRYFLSYILQFQFHRALLRAAGYRGPMHLGSIYGSAEAGARLRTMLEMGSSRQWPDALEAVTGERRMDAAALLEYFAPLQRWLEEQNRLGPTTS